MENNLTLPTEMGSSSDPAINSIPKCILRNERMNMAIRSGCVFWDEWGKVGVSLEEEALTIGFGSIYIKVPGLEINVSGQSN